MRGRKIIAAMMALAMLFSVLPVAVMAEGGKTAEITIQYRDEEQNVIRDNKVITETYNDGDTYTVPDTLKAPFAVKVSDGYNFYEFNPGKSELTAPFAESMTITLVFNNTTQYDYYEDFEDYTVDGAKWTLGAGDLPVINNDHTNYVYHSAGSSTTSAYTKFDAVDTTGKKVQISYDTKLTTPSGTGLSQVSIANSSPSFSSNRVNYGVNSTSSGHILLLGFQSGSLTVNGTSASADFMDKWTHVEAEVDFGSKEVSVTLSADGVASQTVETKIYSSTFDSNIGMVYLRSGGSNGAIAFDNLRIKITGSASAVVPDIESALNFKSVYAFGDSIVYGHNTPAKSFMRLIANDYAMDLNMLAKNGATIIKSDNWILTQVKNAPAAAPDFVVFDGYTNDAYESVMTNLGTQQGPTATTFDNTTFCGAFEETLYTMKQKWPESEIVFITIHKSGGRDWDIQCKLRELSLEMCKAWGISVADVFSDTTLDTRDEAQMKKYIINGAGSHPNESACREFYIPVIVKTMENILSGGDTPTDPTDTGSAKYIFGTDTAAEGVIPVNTDTAYGTHNSKRYGLIDIDESSIQNDYHFDGFTDDVLTYPKSGTFGSDTYITADYSQYDAETLASFGDGVIPVRFAAAGESGAYYTVKATVVNAGDSETEISLFGENRYMILYNHKLAAGEKITKTWNVRLVGQYYNAAGEYIDDAINVAVSGKNAGLVSVEITKHDTIGKTMWLMTDSTGDNSSAALPYFGLRGKAGDGQVFTKYINPEIAINNQGEGGLKSSDTNHFNNALKYMQSGDYLYVQYGFNGETADSLKANLPRYYNAAKEKGATLIVASTSERQSSSFWDSTNYVWKGSNASITAAGKEYVDGVLEADPTAKIAFVDLNTNIIDWMTTETARISTLRGEANPNRLAMNYYFGYDRDSGVDSIHINDAGADNAAYIVYTEMKKNALLNELTSNNSTETPYLVSTDIIQKGWTPNDSYPLPLPSDVTYEYPTIVKGIEYGMAYDPNEEIDKITAAYKADGSLDTVNISKIKASQVEEASNTASQKVFYWKSLESMEPYTRTEGTAVDSIQVMVQGNMQYYAIGAVDILDAEGNVIKTAYSKSTDKNAEINHIDNVASQYGEVYTMYFDKSETVIADGQSVRAYTVAVETGEAPTDEKYSSYYIPYETETTLLDESFSEGISGWSEGGSGSKETSYAEKDGRKAIKLSTTGNGTYNVVKRFDDNAEVSNGILKLHFMINYSYGNMTFKLTPAAATGSYVAGEKTLNIIEGSLQFADGTEIGKLKNGKWTDIDCTIDFIAGTQTASVAGGTPKTVSIDALKSENADDIADYAPIRSFAVTYMSTGSTIPAYSFEMYLADVTAETIKTTLPKYTINAAVADGQSEYGSVTGGGEYDVNSNAEIKATAKTGYEFDGWYDENDNKVSGKSTYSVRVRDNKTLYAKFVQEVIDPNVTKWSFSEYAGKAVNAASSTSEAYTKNGETLNIYLANGDSITEEGLYWAAKGTSGENDTATRYIHYKAPENGKLTITVKASNVDSSQKPRLYFYEGADSTATVKSPLNSFGTTYYKVIDTANTEYQLEYTLEKDKDYVFWTYIYGTTAGRQSAFAISNITYDTRKIL